MKLPIAFPTFISSVLIKKKKIDILSAKDVVGVNPDSLNFRYMLIARNQVSDIVLPKIQNFDITSQVAGQDVGNYERDDVDKEFNEEDVVAIVDEEEDESISSGDSKE